MHSFNFYTSLAILAVFPQFSHAYYACSLSNAIPISDLLPSGGLTQGLTGGSNITPASPGCSFYIAAGGSCTTSKPKDKAKRDDSNGNESPVTLRRRAYSTLPCLDSMSCVTVNGLLSCFDLNNYDYIDDQGTCGNLNTGETETGCVEKFLAAQSSSASATGAQATDTANGAKATGTASGASSTTSSSSAKGGVSNSSAEARVAAGSLLVLFVSVAGLMMV